ncbi:MAG: NAD-dependent epimerase/dehydratase family protein [Deltaproteobacteria bacterium]|nr:NAD-dependent epimerase/dehydratase family protein [Deltaproteobacteria bacterium]
MANKGILVTGGSGLVGAYAVGMLLERGERPVVFDVAVNQRLLEAVGVDTEKVTLIRGDMADLPALISALRDNDCDRIIHLAAFLGEEVQRRPYSGVRLNFMGSVNVFEAARLEKVSRVIFPSSGTVYMGSLGEGLAKIDESIPINPPSVYAATKASCEFMGRAYAKRYGFEFICLRYVGGLYGPSPVALKATREMAIQQMIRAAVKGDSAKINWPYGPTEILYGKDAAKGTVLAVLKDKFKDDLFHIGNGQTVGGDEIIAAVRKKFPESNLELIKGSNPMPYPESRLASDFSRSKEQLGYEPDYSIDKAVEDYAATLKRLENL